MNGVDHGLIATKKRRAQELKEVARATAAAEQELKFRSARINENKKRALELKALVQRKGPVAMNSRVGPSSASSSSVDIVGSDEKVMAFMNSFLVYSFQFSHF
jgi:hypothetical protein